MIRIAFSGVDTRRDSEPAIAGFVARLDPITRCADLYHLPPRGNPIVSLRPVGKTTACRFAVGRPGECSSVFRVWANRDKFDVYASIRTWKGLAKYSFHESGEYIYHLASIEHENAKWVSLPNPDSKRIHTWKKPDPFVPGWTHLVTFMIPTEDVRPSPGSGFEDYQRVRWIDKPAWPHTITEFRVAIGDPGMPLIDAGPSDYLLDAGIVDGFVLINGQVVVVTMHVTAFDATGRQMLSDVRRECTASAPNDFALTESLGPRFAVPNIQSDGRHALWDIGPSPDAMTRE